MRERERKERPQKSQAPECALRAFLIASVQRGAECALVDHGGVVWDEVEAGVAPHLSGNAHSYQHTSGARIAKCALGFGGVLFVMVVAVLVSVAWAS